MLGFSSALCTLYHILKCYFEWPKNIFESVDSIKQWFSFVNNNPTSAQKLILIMFYCE